MSYSIIDDKLAVTYDHWVVAIVRQPDSNNPEHVSIIIEGADCNGQGLLIRYHLVDHDDGSGRAMVLGNARSKYDIKKDARRMLEVLTRAREFCGHAWSMSRDKVNTLINSIEADTTKHIRYEFFGAGSLFVRSKSSEGHNCFSWAREKLLELKDERVEKMLTKRWTDYVGVRPSFHLVPQSK